jgi:integrase
MKPITDATIRSLPETYSGDIRDSLARGLVLRCTPLSKRWSYRYQSNGTTRRLSLGDYPSIGVAAARQKAKELRAGLLLHAADPQDQRAKQKADSAAAKTRTLASIATAYFAAARIGTHKSGAAKPKRDSTIAANEYVYGKHLAPKFGHRDIATLSRRELQAHVDGVAATMPGAAKLVRDVSRQICSYAVRQEVLDGNPCAGLSVPTVAPRERTLSDAETKLLWSQFETMGAAGTALRLILATGQRPGEVVGMTWQEIDLQRATWTIPSARHKGHRNHLVPLSGLALRLLEDAKAFKLEDGKLETPDIPDGKVSGPVFPSDLISGPRDRRAVTALLKRLCARLKMSPAARPHDLRRTAATGMGRLGHSLVVPHVLGHADSSVTARHYNFHSFEGEKRTALESWAAELERIVTAPDNVVPMRKVA